MNLPITAALVAVAAGGAIGSVLRFLTGGWVARRMMAGHPEMALPVATMLVNVAGSFLIGLLIAWMEHFVRDPALRDGLRAFLIVGVLGGFTTFSTFSLETVQLIEYGLWGKALLNIIASATLCVAAAFAGLALMRWLV